MATNDKYRDFCRISLENSLKQQTTKPKSKQQTLEKEYILIFWVTLLYYLKCPVFNKINYKTCKETKKYNQKHYTGKNQSIENVFEEIHMLNLLKTLT